LIFNGEIYHGVDGSAGEIGHICVEPDGVPCGCGSNGCLEQYASATAIVRIAREMSAEFPGSPLSGLPELTALDLFTAARKGDMLASEAFRSVARYLGIALAGLVNVLNPEMIVIAGGMAAGWELLTDNVRAELEKRAFREPAERAKLVPAKLGDDAGILGAARLAYLSRKFSTQQFV
jgi:glucokinase